MLQNIKKNMIQQYSNSMVREHTIEMGKPYEQWFIVT